MERSDALKEMAEQFPGGQAGVAALLGLTVSALRNRLYEIKGQRINCDEAVALSLASGSDAWIQSLCADLGGVFVHLPHVDAGREDILDKFNELYAELGELSSDFRHAVEDEEIDDQEAERLENDGRRITATVHELLKLSFAIYRRSKGNV